MLNSKKGGDKIISVYWFFILVLVAGGVFLMVSNFYGHPYDVREVEADILANQVSDCVYYGGKLNQNVFLVPEQKIFSELFANNFLEECGFTFGSVPEYYFEINFYEYPVPGNSLYEISKGDPNWKTDCELKDEGYEKLVTCVEKDFFAKNVDGTIYFIKVLSMVRKTEQNVKQ
ncbi:MAG: hypothetical protein KC516_00495 [Nanoarchaeota archaeon]|nr:hypothetical protein [Nanoarchaeota archaeon]